MFSAVLFVCPDQFVVVSIEKGSRNTAWSVSTGYTIVVVVLAIVKAGGVRRGVVWVVWVRVRVRRRIRERPRIGVGGLGACPGADWQTFVPTSAFIVKPGPSVIIVSRLAVVIVSGLPVITVD